MARNKWVQLTILAVIIAAGAFTIGANLSKTPAPKVGETAPNFSLYGLDGAAYELNDFIGHPVVLNFWGSFCEPCVREMPLLQKKYEKYRDQGLVVLGVNLDESTVTINNFIRGMNITFPILLDKNVVRKQYGVYNYPTTFFISRDGRIQDIKVGGMTEEDIEQRILKLMEA